jgi:polyribonucleotide nucleotidyltransferase
MRNDVQVILMPLVHDQENDVDMLSIIAASTALTISDIPWGGPIGAARIGYIDNELVVNPTIPQMVDSTLDLRVAGTADAILMVECTADEVPESVMLEALRLAHESMQPVIQLQQELREKIGKEKREFLTGEEEEGDTTALRAEVLSKVSKDIAEIVATKTDRDDRNVALDDLRERIIADYMPEEDEATDPDGVPLKAIRESISDALKTEVRRRIVAENIRPDGRRPDDIRDLAAEVELLPRVHGSGLFKRGQTQVMSICTLGMPGDSQLLDGLHPEENKRYLHHYNFPPYSTGETWMMRGPKRREIGHGALAENALLSVLPTESEFPYTIRVVSEVMSSNGSTSMASVCGSTLALMDAGVPIRKPVGGIAMGLIKESDEYVVLTDIQGMEDHLGDMDFKVAGTRDGITALQMDIKISGIPNHIMELALERAYDARMKILDVIQGSIAEPRAELSPYAPRIEVIQIDPESIGLVIGPGGKTIRGMQEATNTKIDIGEDGQVYIAADNSVDSQRASEMVLALLEKPEVGRIYTGRITRLEPYGAFVEFLPNTEGMVHISQMSDTRVENIKDEFSLNDEVMVMVTDIDNSGKIRLSRQAVLEGWTAEEARSRDRKGSSSSGGRGGSRGGNRGGNRRRRR